MSSNQSRELAYVNGVITPLEEAVISINDRGLQFADSVYEALRVYGGKPFHLEAHLLRLERSLRGLQMTTSVDALGLGDVIATLVQRSGIEEGFVYIQVTRGTAPRALPFPPEDVPPNVIVTYKHLQALTDEKKTHGVTAITVADTRWKRNDLKTTCRLSNVLVRQEAKDRGAHEALFVDGNERLLEGTATNVYFVKDGELLTPPLSEGILPGVTRKVILEIAHKAEVPVQEDYVTIGELRQVDEAFLSATTIEVCPLVKIDDVTIGDGKPGPVTLRLRAAFSELVEEFRQEPRPTGVSSTE